jgi:hypothetical protein
VTIWKRYFAIVLAAIPAALLADMLISRGGLSERAAMMIGVPFALALAFLLWRVVIQRQSLPRKDHKRVIVKLPQSSQ